LRRYLGDLPLVGVSNRSWAERWRKWRRRRPHALALIGICLAFFAVVAAAGGSALVQIQRRYDDARHDLENGQEQMAKGEWEMAKETLTRGLSLASTVPFSADLQRDLAAQVQMVREKQAAWNFHQVADQIRLKAVADSLSVRDLQDLEKSCRAAWSSRPLIATRLGNLEGEERQRIRADFLELAVLEAGLRVRLASKSEERAARESALHVLEEAEATFGPSRVLCREQQTHAEALGLAEVAVQAKTKGDGLPPATSWEHCALGRSHLQSGHLDDAAEEFKEAIGLEPGGLWPNYYYGVCVYRLNRAKEALEPFSVCLGAASRTNATSGDQNTKRIQAQILYNRALAHAATGAIPQAIEDYSSVLNVDPDMGKAALNRGVLHYKRQMYEQAKADLERALNLNAPPAVVHYNLALVCSAQKNHDAALAHVRKALQHEPGNKDAQALLKKLTGHP
jgi:tetratricopeptide (TPR) repeat protein